MTFTFTFLVSLIISSFSQPASAHLKWFVDNNQEIKSDIHYSLFSIEVLVGIVFCLMAIGAALIINKKLTFDSKLSDTSKQWLIRIFSILIGVSLLASSYSGSVIAAHYVVSTPTLVVLQYAQAIVGLMLIFNLFTKHAALILIFIYAVLGLQFGLLEILDYLNILGVALYLLLSTDGDKAKNDFAIPVIRVFTGCALIVLAFSEKLLNPNLGLNFLASHNWNFMKNIGVVGYSNELFILSAGFVEMLIGILFVFGLVTRINTLVLLGFMITSNLVFLFQNSISNALLELSGHLPVIAIALILLASGSGEKWRVK